MIKGNRHHRIPDPLMLLTGAAILGVLISTNIHAAEPSGMKTLTEPARVVPAVTLMGYSIGRSDYEGPQLDISMTPPAESTSGFNAAGDSGQESGKLTDIFFSVRFKW